MATNFLTAYRNVTPIVAILLGVLVSCNQKVPSEKEVQKLREVSTVTDLKADEQLPQEGLPSALPRGVKRLVSDSCTGDIQKRSRGVKLIDSQEHLQKALEQVGLPLNSIESVDFGRFVVVAAYAGEQSDCGYEVLLYEDHSTEQASNPVVRAVTTRTLDTCRTGVAADSISYPFAFAKFPRLTNGQSYELREETNVECR